MLRELIRAEWDRRGLGVALLLGLYLAVPLRYAAALRGGLSEPEVDGASGLAQFLVLTIVIAAAAWGSGVFTAERKTGWAYVLSLPVDRVRLFALRYLAGLAWLALMVAAAALASFAVAAAAADELPRFVYAYPGPFATWLALASWMAYTLGFAVGVRWDQPGRAFGLGLLGLYLLALPVIGLAAPLLEGPLSPLRLVLENVMLLGS